MSGSGMLKPDRDFTKDVDKQLPEAEKLAKVLISRMPAIHLLILHTEQCTSGC